MMSYLSFTFLFALFSIYVNRDSAKSLALAFIVCAGVFLPLPSSYFYLSAFCVESAIGLFALFIRLPHSIVIAKISGILAFLHVCGYIFDGSNPASFYHCTVKIGEISQMLTCIIFSHVNIKIWTKNATCK